MVKKVIALTGGSTGGHIFPLLSVFNYLRENKELGFIWVGEEYSLEEEIANRNRIKFLGISAGKLRRYYDYRNLYEPLKNLTGIVYGIYYILKYKIDIVFSKGGYVSIPLCIAAFLLRKKIFVHESDTISGVSNKLIGFFATKIFYTFPNEKLDNKKYYLSGQILNPELLDYLDDHLVEENEKLTVIVTGGSQGSTIIFNALLKILPDLPDIVFHIVLGEKNMHFRPEFKKFSNTVVHDFITQKRLGKILKNVDIAITRGGATTLWELNVFGIHSIIVPLSHSAGNHQMKNAEYFKQEFGSDILNEKSKLDEELYRKLERYRELRKGGLNLEEFYRPLKLIEREIIK